MLRKLIASRNKQSLGVAGQSMVLSASIQLPGLGLGRFTTYCKYFSDLSFWTKIANYAKKIGRTAAEKLLILYFCAQDSDTPKWVKTVIVGVLGYFILPLDAIPDFTPGVGFSDDMSLIVLALGWVAIHFKDEHKKRAQDALKRLFD